MAKPEYYSAPNPQLPNYLLITSTIQSNNSLQEWQYFYSFSLLMKLLKDPERTQEWQESRPFPLCILRHTFLLRGNHGDEIK